MKKRRKKIYFQRSNPIARDLRTSKYQTRIIKNKKKDDPFGKSVKELLEEMDQDELREIEDRNGF